MEQKIKYHSYKINLNGGILLKTSTYADQFNLNNNSQDIYKRITEIKAELHELVSKFGMVHELTVAKSQELDLVVNEYMTSKQQY